MFLKGLILFLLTTVSLSLYINANDNFYINSSYDGIMMSVTMSFSFNEPTQLLIDCALLNPVNNHSIRALLQDKKQIKFVPQFPARLVYANEYSDGQYWLILKQKLAQDATGIFELITLTIYSSTHDTHLTMLMPLLKLPISAFQIKPIPLHSCNGVLVAKHVSHGEIDLTLFSESTFKIKKQSRWGFTDANRGLYYSRFKGNASGKTLLETQHGTCNLDFEVSRQEMANFSKHSFTLQDALRLSNELEFVLENAGEL